MGKVILVGETADVLRSLGCDIPDGDLSFADFMLALRKVKYDDADVTLAVVATGPALEMVAEPVDERPEGEPDEPDDLAGEPDVAGVKRKKKK